MTAEVPKTGFVKVDEGRLFWKYNPSVYDKYSAESGPKPRPVLLFIHAYVFLASISPFCYNNLRLMTYVYWDCLSVEVIQGSMNPSR